MTKTVTGLRALIAIFAVFALSLSAYAASPEGLADGPGTWVNMWNYPNSDVEGYCLKLHASGLRNLFIQTSRSNTEAICHPDKLGPLIEACHRYKIRVIAWSFAELANPIADAQKLIAAARFVSPKGEKVDAIAANLEKDLNQTKVESYAQCLREALGPSYPMVAVVYSPMNKAPQVAVTPWKLIDKYFDVIAPMNYWNGRYHQFDPSNYTLSTIQKIRELVGRPDVEIHIIGDGMGTQPAEIEQFLKACRNGEATSASLYPNQCITAPQLEALSHYSDYFPVNSRFRLAAFRELIKTGALDPSQIKDPSRLITRGEYFRLVLSQLGSPGASSMSDKELIDVLTRAHVLPKAHADSEGELASLNLPVDSAEGIALVAKVVDQKANLDKLLANSAGGQKAKHRADRWFVQPAFAESNIKPASPSERPFTYMDAAQVVLQATSATQTK